MKELMKIEEEGLLKDGMHVVAYSTGYPLMLGYKTSNKRWQPLDNNYRNTIPLTTQTLVDLYESVHFVVRYDDELPLAKRLLLEN